MDRSTEMLLSLTNLMLITSNFTMVIKLNPNKYLISFYMAYDFKLFYHFFLDEWQQSFFLMLICSNGCPTETVLFFFFWRGRGVVVGVCAHTFLCLIDAYYL